jgi:general secretion pathway protein M
VSTSLPQWVGRLAALTLLLGLLGVSYLYVVAPVLAAYQNIDDSLEETSALLQRYEGVARTRDIYQARLDELTARLSGTGIYLSGGTDALAAAELQAHVRKAVDLHNGQLRSIQNLPARSDGDFRRLGVRVQFSASLSSFHTILYGLESAIPYLFVDNLDIHNRRANRRSAHENLDPHLTVRLDLSGYLKPEGMP